MQNEFNCEEFICGEFPKDTLVFENWNGEKVTIKLQTTIAESLQYEFVEDMASKYGIQVPREYHAYILYAEASETVVMLAHNGRTLGLYSGTIL